MLASLLVINILTESKVEVCFPAGYKVVGGNDERQNWALYLGQDLQYWYLVQVLYLNSLHTTYVNNTFLYIFRIYIIHYIIIIYTITNIQLK